MKLIIKESSWSGWTRDYKPKEVEKTYDIEMEKKYVIKTCKVGLTENERIEEVFSFDVIEVKDDSITIRPYQNLNVMNLITKAFVHDGRSKENEYSITIKLDETIKFSTPTYDAGDTFYLTLTE